MKYSKKSRLGKNNPNQQNPHSKIRYSHSVGDDRYGSKFGNPRVRNIVYHYRYSLHYYNQKDPYNLQLTKNKCLVDRLLINSHHYNDDGELLKNCI